MLVVMDVTMLSGVGVYYTLKMPEVLHCQNGAKSLNYSHFYEVKKIISLVFGPKMLGAGGHWRISPLVYVHAAAYALYLVVPAKNAFVYEQFFPINIGLKGSRGHSLFTVMNRTIRG